jgi:hypothetical protein
MQARRRRDYAWQVEIAAELWSRKDGTNEDRVVMVADPMRRWRLSRGRVASCSGMRSCFVAR